MSNQTWNNDPKPEDSGDDQNSGGYTPPGYSAPDQGGQTPGGYQPGQTDNGLQHWGGHLPDGLYKTGGTLRQIA